TEAFDVSQYLKSILTEYSIVDLLKKDNELIAEMKQIDSDRKTLFYENYSKLINASDTIKDMRENVESMEKELVKLSQQVQDITSLASNLHETFAPKKTQVYNLKSSASLLRRLQFLFSLPKKLSQSSKDGSYLRAVQFFSTTRETLERYQNVPVFSKVASEAKTAVTQIRASILQKLKKGDLSFPQLIESVQVLVAIAMDPPTKLIDLLLDNGLKIVSLTLKQDVPWLPLVSEIHSEAISLFKEEQTDPAQTKKSPIVIFLPPNDFIIFKNKLEQFLKKAFDLWETQFKVADFFVNLERHLSFREQLTCFSEIVDFMSNQSRLVMESILTEEMQNITTITQNSLLKLLSESPEHLDDAFAETLKALMGKLENILAKLGQDPQTSLFNNTILVFFEKLYSNTSLEPTSKLSLIQLAQSITMGTFDYLLKCDRIPLTEIKNICKMVAERDLACFVNTQAITLENAMQEWVAPNGHPKGISSCVHYVCKQLNQLHQMVNRIFHDGQDGLSMDSSLTHAKVQDSSGASLSYTSHHHSHSSTSLRSSPNKTMSGMDKSPMLKMDKFFSEKLTFYARPNINGFKYPIMPLLLRIFAKGWLEQVRLQTLTKFGFQQIIIDVEFCKLHFNEIIKDRHSLSLLEDVVTSSYRRCVDPLFLSKEVLKIYKNLPL
ncbi:Vacuolar protein sorting-associated protein 51, partial [Coelomomyces lativittatus]